MLAIAVVAAVSAAWPRAFGGPVPVAAVESPPGSVVSGATRRVPTASPPGSGFAGGGGTELYGYLPYWEMTAAMADYLAGVPLTSIELFSVSSNRNGTINHRQPGYKRVTGPIGARIIAEAHTRGERVDLVFSSFGFDRNAALFGVTPTPLGDPRWRTDLDPPPPTGPSATAARTADGLVALVQELGLDGVNIDVEQIASPSYDGFAAFVSAVRRGLSGVNPALRLSVATMANHFGANLAAVAVSAGADRIFLMGYDFHWSGSDPGGSSPVDRLDGGPTLTTAIAAYAAAGVPADHVLLGLPLYGMAWPVASPDRYAIRVGPGRAWLPSKHVAELSAAGFLPHPDPLEVTEYLSEPIAPTAAAPDTTLWRAIFYDSPRTLRAKLALARASGFAGGGFWALGYERGVPGYLSLMADFLAGRVAPAPTDVRTGSAAEPACVARC